MLQTEYVRNLNSNYLRVLLDNKPEENKYQYCIINRGGIKGLLSSSLRYINGLAYLYYDITSTQNTAQIFSGKTINRSWIKDFLWSIQQVHLELSRFLLDDRNVLWHPEQIFQDVEKNDFNFIYIPYYDGNNGFLSLIEFWVEHIDYEDEVLVECIYKMHEQFDFLGSVYLQEQIFADARVLDKIPQVLAFDSYQENVSCNHNEMLKPGINNEAAAIFHETNIESSQRKYSEAEKNIIQEQVKENDKEINCDTVSEENRISKRGIWYLLDGKRRKQKENIENKNNYRKEIKQRMEGLAVSEETIYPDEQNEDFGKTIYIEETEQKKESVPVLCAKEGKKTVEIIKTPFIIGKKKEEADLVLEDNSISRIHARIIKENNEMYIEDMNSTNGTYKNGLRMQPYEKKLLDEEDEIKFGKEIFIYR